jgi:hypothetical protein
MILRPFFQELTEEERLYGWFQQDSATAHTAHHSKQVIREVFGERVISDGLWPPRSPDLTPCDFYLWGNLKERVYQTNPRSLEDLKDGICREISRISTAELKRVHGNVFRRMRICLAVQGKHFEHLL